MQVSLVRLSLRETLRQIMGLLFKYIKQKTKKIFTYYGCKFTMMEAEGQFRGRFYEGRGRIGGTLVLFVGLKW